MTDATGFENRSILITGGAGHLGRSLSLQLCRLGADVIVADTEDACTDAAEDQFAEFVDSRQIHLVPVDLADASAARTLPAEALRLTGRLDGLVHSASLVGTSAVPGWTGELSEQSLETWRLAFEINVNSAFVLLQAATPHFTSGCGASTVLVSSIYGFLAHDPSLYHRTSMSLPAAYSVSKAALIQLARWFASEWGARARCNAVSPGGIERSQDPEFRTRYESKTILGRMATEDEVANAIVFLLSDSARYVTGQNLIVDGGLSIR